MHRYGLMAVEGRTGIPWQGMRRCCLCIGLLIGVLPVTVGAQRPTTVPLVFDRIAVVDVETGQVLPERRVVIVGNRIQALGPADSMPVPAGATVVAAPGRYLIPGLWDLHTHTTVQGAGVTADSAALPHQVAAVFRMEIANGITGVRDPGSRVPLATWRTWKHEIATGQRVGPRFLVSGPSLDNVDFLPQHQRKPCVRATYGAVVPHICVTGPADARRVVDSLHAAGADMIKTYGLSDTATYFAVAAEARRLGMPFGGHLYATDGLTASDSGARILDHELYTKVCGDPGDTVWSLTHCAAAAARWRRNNTWWVPKELGGPTPPLTTDSVAWAILQPSLPQTYGGLIYTGAERVAQEHLQWQPLTVAARRALPSGQDLAMAYTAHSDSALHNKGCQRALLAYAVDLPVMPGMDWPVGGLGAWLHRFLWWPTLCGVPPLWMLQTATLNPARAFGVMDSLGTVAVGKVADLVLLEGNPLDDIWNVSKIVAVVANGRYFDRAALDQLVMEANEEWRRVGQLKLEANAQRKAERIKGRGGQPKGAQAIPETNARPTP